MDFGPVYYPPWSSSNLDPVWESSTLDLLGRPNNHPIAAHEYHFGLGAGSTDRPQASSACPRAARVRPPAHVGRGRGNRSG
jgi:hypothetical protein